MGTPFQAQPYGDIFSRPSAMTHQFVSLGLSRNVARFLAFTITRRASTRGSEDTVIWLKNLANEVLTGELAPWNSRLHGRSYWVSILLQNLPQSRVLRIFRIYTLVKAEKASPKQLNKFFGSMALPNKPVPESLVDLFDLGVQILLGQFRGTVNIKEIDSFSFSKMMQSPRSRPRYVLESGGFHLRNTPSRDGLKAQMASVSSDARLLSDWMIHSKRFGDQGVNVSVLFSKTLQLQALSRPYGLKYDRSWEDLAVDRITDLFTRLPVGKVSGIQESGYKLRAVANPHPILQWLMSPLKDLSFDFLRGLPNDCTFNQTRYMEDVRASLRSNYDSLSTSPKSEKVQDIVHTYHSVDLSDATNSFPMNVQIRIFRSIIDRLVPSDVDEKANKLLHQSLEMFKVVSRSEWEQSFDSSRPNDVRWTKGQPLGLGPSFALFSVAHHALLSGLQALHGGEYFILGDDIVIRGDSLHAGYLSALDELGVNFSPEKSISSDTLVEFAGFVVTPFRYYRKGKMLNFDRFDRSQSLAYVKDYPDVGLDYLITALDMNYITEPVLRKIAFETIMVSCFLPPELGYPGNFHDSWDWGRYVFPAHMSSKAHTGIIRKTLPLGIDLLNSQLASDSLPSIWKNWNYRELLDPTLFREGSFSSPVTVLPLATKQSTKKFFRRLLSGIGYENQLSFCKWFLDRAPHIEEKELEAWLFY